MRFYIVNQTARSNMSAKIKVFIVENGTLRNITFKETEKGWANYSTIHGFGFERAHEWCRQWLKKQNLINETIDIEYLNNFEKFGL